MVTSQNRDRDKAEMFKSFFVFVFNMNERQKESQCSELKDHDCKNGQFQVNPDTLQALLLQLGP